MDKRLSEDHLESMGESLTEDIPDFMQDRVQYWIRNIYINSAKDSLYVATYLKNKLRIHHISLSPPYYFICSRKDHRSFAYLLHQLASKLKTDLFFTVIDRLLYENYLRRSAIEDFRDILNEVNHQYMVKEIDKSAYMIIKRISEQDEKIVDDIFLKNKNYSKHFLEGFKKLYGMEPNNSQAIDEFYKSIESALKYVLDVSSKQDKNYNLDNLLNKEIIPKRKNKTIKFINNLVDFDPFNDIDNKQDGKKCERKCECKSANTLGNNLISQIRFVKKKLNHFRHAEKENVREANFDQTECLFKYTALILYQLSKLRLSKQ